MRLQRFGALMFVVVSVACSAEPTGGGGASTSSTPSGSASPSADVLAFEGGGAAMAPGRYAYDGFTGPRMTFAVGSGWIGGHELPEFFDVQRAAGGVLLGFADPTFVQSSVGRLDVAELTAEGAVRSIASIGLLDAGRVRSTTVGGRAASEVRASAGRFVQLFGGDDGSFTVDPSAVRLLAVEVRGDLMLIIVSVFEEQPARVERAIGGVIASVRFG
jgi:hypothetical protein